MTDPTLTMEAIGRAGFTISICCGPSGLDPFRWTVQVMSRHGDEFDRPFGADSFAHAVAIAVTEIANRGWMAPAEKGGDL